MAVQIARIEFGRLHVNTESFGQILDKVGAQPVTVVAVSGPLHRGKFNINDLLLRFLFANEDNYEDSFQLTQVTEGLWKTPTDQPNQILMWPEPLRAIHNGRSICVLLMSVHGNFDGTITTKENALIFAFGCLLSSVMVYNVENGISEDMLQFLQMTISSAKAISHQEYSCPFAKLLFIINDWQFPADYVYGFHEDNSSPSMRNFKKEKLDVQTGALPENRAVKQEILSSFQEVCCCLVPNFGGFMVKNEGPLQDLGKWIFRKGDSISKTVQRMEVTGIELKGHVQKWAESLVVTKLLTFKTNVEAPSELLDAVALSVALKLFRWEMTSAIRERSNLTDAQLRDIHACNKQVAVAAFKRTTIERQETVLQSYVGMLTTEVDQSFEEFQRMNAAKIPGMIPRHVPVDTGLADRRRRCKKYCMFFSIFFIISNIIGVILFFQRIKQYNKAVIDSHQG